MVTCHLRIDDGHLRYRFRILACGFVFTISSTIFGDAWHVYQGELFPTHARATVAGVAYSASRVSTALLPFILVPVLYGSGPVAVFVVIGVTTLIALADVVLFGPNTTGRSLEKLILWGREKQYPQILLRRYMAVVNEVCLGCPYEPRRQRIAVKRSSSWILFNGCYGSSRRGTGALQDAIICDGTLRMGGLGKPTSPLWRFPVG